MAGWTVGAAFMAAMAILHQYRKKVKGFEDQAEKKYPNNDFQYIEDGEHKIIAKDIDGKFETSVKTEDGQISDLKKMYEDQHDPKRF